MISSRRPRVSLLLKKKKRRSATTTARDRTRIQGLSINPLGIRSQDQHFAEKQVKKIGKNSLALVSFTGIFGNDPTKSLVSCHHPSNPQQPIHSLRLARTSKGGFNSH